MLLETWTSGIIAAAVAVSVHQDCLSDLLEEVEEHPLRLLLSSVGNEDSIEQHLDHLEQFQHHERGEERWQPWPLGLRRSLPFAASRTRSFQVCREAMQTIKGDQLKTSVIYRTTLCEWGKVTHLIRSNLISRSKLLVSSTPFLLSSFLFLMVPKLL